MEASTVVLLASLTTIEDGAFLADDTMVASYDLRGGWRTLGRVTIGRRAFLGNSGTASAGHVVPADDLGGGAVVAPTRRRRLVFSSTRRRVRLRRIVVDGANGWTYRQAGGESCDPRRVEPVPAVRGAHRRHAIGLGVMLTLAWLDERLGHSLGPAALRHRDARRRDRGPPS